MKKLTFWVLLTLLSTFSVFAQNKIVTVSGKLVENDTKEPVEMAAIQLLSLPDSAQVSGVISQKQGIFTLPKASPGKYVLKISFVGYLTQYIPLQLASNATTKNVGTIPLFTDAVMLDEAVVVAEAPPVVVRGDTTEYSASAYRVAEGSMLEELVKKIPGMEISTEGKMVHNGKEIKKILVDGKEFFSDDPQVSMKNLPASIVDKVKAYEKKSDNSRITGIDDGEEESVLDLTVKKGMKQGWFGNVITGYGDKERYEAGVMASRFKDDSNFSIIGSTNNTNNKGFSEFGDAGQGMGGDAGRGVTSSNSLGVNFAKVTKKIEVGGNLQYGYSDNDAVTTSDTETFLSNGESNYQQVDRFSRRKRHDFRADMRLEWKPDTLTTIIFRPGASYSQTESVTGSNSNQQNFLLEDVNRRVSSSSSDGDNFSFNGRFQLFRRLNTKGRNFSVGANFGYGDNGSDVFSGSETVFFVNDSTSKTERYTNRSGDRNNWSVQASYTEPVFNKHYLELRYEYAHRRSTSQSLVYDSINKYPLNYLERGYVDSLSSRVENYYNTHTFNLSLRANYEKLRYSFGVGLTPQSSLSESPIGPNSSRGGLKQNVMNWAPSAMFRYMVTRQHFLMFRYNGRSSAPDAEDLQEVIDVTDPMNLQYGNPNLKPMFTNTFMMNYSRFFPETMRSLLVNMFYTNTLNRISNKTSYDQSTGASISQRVNVNGNWNVRGGINFNTPLKNKKFTVSTNTNIQYSDQVSYSSMGGGKTDWVLSTTHTFAAEEALRGSYRSDVFDISLNTNVKYNVTKNGMNESKNNETVDYILGGNTNVNLPWRFFISTDASYWIKRGYSGDFNTNELIWNAQVSKNIFKKSQGTIRLKIYDILGQQTNLSRSISESRITDSETNTLGSYFMVHFVYRFNTFGSGQRSERRNFEGGGERRGFGGGGGGGAPGGGGGGGGGGRPF